MPIRMSDSRDDDAVRNAVAAIVSRRAASGTPAKVVRSAAPLSARSFDVAGPHRVFSIGLGDAGAGMLQRAEMIGSRHFVLEGDRPVAMVQISDDGSRLSNVTFGALAGSMLHAIDVAEALPQVAGNDVELRAVEIPGIYLIALWLVGDATTILIPLDPAPWPLEGNRPYDVNEFETAAAQAVELKTRRGGTGS